jgi:hypothetical protein
MPKIKYYIPGQVEVLNRNKNPFEPRVFARVCDNGRSLQHDGKNYRSPTSFIMHNKPPLYKGVFFMYTEGPWKSLYLQEAEISKQQLAEYLVDPFEPFFCDTTSEPAVEQATSDMGGTFSVDAQSAQEPRTTANTAVYEDMLELYALLHQISDEPDADSDRDRRNPFTSIDVPTYIQN